MPFGQLPVLEVDGQPIPQSNAIARYLGRKYGLAGVDEWESMLCDVLVDSLGDLRQGKQILFYLAKPREFGNCVLKCSKADRARIHFYGFL
jgi:hypothetical protein